MVNSRNWNVASRSAFPSALVLGLVSLSVPFVGCDGSTGRHFGSPDSYVTAGTGGAARLDETGGTNGSGGAIAQGGSGQSGGTPGSGGAGGVPGTGGHTSTGGADAGTDGPSTSADAMTVDARGTGGAGTGGAATGGNGTGGRGTGGTGTGGGATGGAATGGAATGGAATGGAATGGAATGGAATGGAATGGAATGGAATGGAGTGGAGTGGAGTGGAGGTVARCHVVVNEIQTGTEGAASDEFVELFNTCADSQDLAGHSLNYRSANNNSGTGDITLYVFPTDSKIAGHGYVIVAGMNFRVGSGGPRFATGGLAAIGGAVALRNPGGVIVDGVSYDTLTTTNIFTEGVPAVNPPIASSIVRVPDGTDTDNNARDFSVSLVASPGASN